MRNLIQNAINHTEEGQITVSASEYDDDFIRISVKDTGSGISEEKKKTIFATENHADGHGFGLIICRNIIKLHDSETRKGCRIWVEDNEEDGHGAVFNFIIAKLKKE